MKKYKLRTDLPSGEKKFTVDYRAELNPQQFQAATHLTGPHLVIAGAGSGKTRTLIFRVAFLVESGIDPGSILLLTFTRRAAQEMMRRAASMLDDRCSRVSGGTFHSFANFILRKYAQAVGFSSQFTIVDRGDAEDIIQMIRTDLGFGSSNKRFPKKGTINDVISRAVNKCLPLDRVLMDDYPQFAAILPDIEKIAGQYRNYKQAKGIMDYDDLLIYLHRLLKEQAEIRKHISHTYRYIMVDEFQDTNRLQAEISALLASEHGNIMAVGDDSQSIYSFRGADFRNIMDFPSLFPGTVITTLEQNYRSTRPILDLTNAIIENAHEKYSKKLFSFIDGQGKPVFLESLSEEEQAAFVAQRILEIREEGVPLDRIAVLFRASWHANELELELKNRGIPYVKYGGLKFTEAAHIKDVLAFMRVVYNPLDEIAWRRVLPLMEGIGPTYATRIAAAVVTAGGELDALIGPEFTNKKFSENLHKLYKALSHLRQPGISPAEQLQKVIVFYTPFFTIHYDDYRRREDDLDSLLRISNRYQTLEHLLTDMVLDPLDGSQVGVKPADKDEEKLVLSTIHSAKGLEWHSVFIIHLVDGYFPSAQSIAREEEVEEERRLFYVAATRAQRNLYLLVPDLETRAWGYYQSYGHLISQPSRFIAEIKNLSDLVEYWAIEPEVSQPF